MGLAASPTCSVSTRRGELEPPIEVEDLLADLLLRVPGGMARAEAMEERSSDRCLQCM